MAASVETDDYARGRRDGFRDGVRENARLGISVLLDQQRLVVQRLERLAVLLGADEPDEALERELERSSAYWKTEP